MIYHPKFPPPIASCKDLPGFCSNFAGSLRLFCRENSGTRRPITLVLWPSEHDAAPSGPGTPPREKTMASSPGSPMRQRHTSLGHHAFAGQPVSTLLIARRVAPRFTPWHNAMKVSAAWRHSPRLGARPEGYDGRLARLTRAFLLGPCGGSRSEWRKMYGSDPGQNHYCVARAKVSP